MPTRKKSSKKKTSARRSTPKKSKKAKTPKKKAVAQKKRVPKKPVGKKPAYQKPMVTNIVGTKPLVTGIAVAPKSTLTFITETLPAFTVGKAGSTAIEVSGGKPPYLFQVVQGTLPKGLILTWGGTLHGTASQTADTTIYVRVDDDFGAKLTEAFNVEVY